MIYIINLEEATKRRDEMLQELKNVNCSGVFFKAVDGRKFSQEQICKVMDFKRAQKEYRILTGGELGCALSHVGVWDNLISSKEHSMVVLEDDVLLSPDFANTIDRLSVLYAESASPILVLLGKADVCYRGAVPIGDVAKLHCVRYARGTYGYWVNRAGANCLKQFMCPVWMEIDNWPFIISKTKLNVYCLSDAVVGLSAENDNSTIGNERNQLEYRRIYRGNLLQRVFLRLYHSIRLRAVALIEFIDPRIMEKGNNAYIAHG